MAEAARTSWTYLKANWHSFELHLEGGEAILKEFYAEGKEPRITRCTLDAFLGGEMHDLVNASMNADVLPAALESVRGLVKKKDSGVSFKNAYLGLILKEAASLPEQFRSAFGKLSLEQLNWKPNPETWSVGECIDHLIVTNRSYFAQLEAISRGDKYISIWEKMGLFSGMLGRMLLKITAEKVVKPAKSPSAFAPTRSKVPATIIEEFCIQQVALIDKVQKTDSVDHEKTLISSPAMIWATYSLRDGVEIIFQHERRHFRQAVAVLGRAEFPKA